MDYDISEKYIVCQSLLFGEHVPKSAILIGFPVIVSLDNKGAYNRIKRSVNNKEKAIALGKAINLYLKINDDLKLIVVSWLYPASHILSRKNVISKLKMQSVSLYKIVNDKFYNNFDRYATIVSLFSSDGAIEFLSKPRFRNDLSFSNNLVYNLLFLLPCVIYGDEKKLLQWLRKFVKRENNMSDEKVWKILNNIERILIEHFDVEIVVFPPLIEDEIEDGLIEINEEMLKTMKKHGYDITMF